MVNLDHFLGEISLSTSVSAQPLIERAIIQTAIDFCDETQVWKDYVDDVVLAPSVSTYDVCADQLIKIVQIEEVYLDGERISPIDTDDLRYNWKSEEAEKPIAYYLDSREVINFYPKLNDKGNGTVRIYASLKPHRKAASLPDILADDWYDAIVFGAKARLHSMRRMDFYDSLAARESRKEYKNEKTRAKNLVSRSFINKDLKSRIRPAA